jgi:tetratricopeptide (TPR) repeat protein
MDLLAQRAVEEAIKGNWLEAQKLNEEILEEDNKNREALNRLARAYSELGKIPKAIATYKKVLKVDPYNSIAQKALSRLEAIKDKPIKKPNGHGNGISFLSSSIFIEEPGKTKAATLLHLGGPKILASLDAGEKVKFSIQSHRVSVVNYSDEYIGRLTDDLANRIIKFTRMGNEYAVFIRSVTPEVKVFIKEVRRCAELKDTPSFPSSEKPGYVSFTSPDSIHDERPDTQTTEEVDAREE